MNQLTRSSTQCSDLFSDSSTRGFIMEEISLQDLVEAIEEVASCAICLEKVEPPVILCANGHGTCSHCRGSLSKCPSCSGSFLDTQVRILDQILELVPKKCKYSEEGCEVFVNPAFNKTHEKFCQFRPIRCMIGQDESCTWRGSLIKWESHVKDEHDSHHFEEFNLNELSWWYYYRDWKKRTRLVLVDNELFLDFSCSMNGKWVQAMRFIPKQTPSHDYYFTIATADHKDDFILVYKMKASLMDESESIENSDNCVSFPIKALENALQDEYGDLQVQFTVNREDIKN